MNDKKQARSVVITGASGNLGRAVVTRFARAGARLSLVARTEHGLAALSESAGAANALRVPADVTSLESMQQCVEKVLQRWGTIDVVVHVAGGFSMGEPVATLSRTTWQHMLELNAWSFVTVTQPVIPVMRTQRSGKIIAVTSRGALHGQAALAAYAASKSALMRLVESLGQEEREHNIQVNSVAPGTLDTQENREAMPSADRAGWTSTEAAAEVIAFLASDAASALCGQHIVLGA